MEPLDPRWLVAFTREELVRLIPARQQLPFDYPDSGGPATVVQDSYQSLIVRCSLNRLGSDQRKRPRGSPKVVHLKRVGACRHFVVPATCRQK